MVKHTEEESIGKKSDNKNHKSVNDFKLTVVNLGFGNHKEIFDKINESEFIEGFK